MTEPLLPVLAEADQSQSAILHPDLRIFYLGKHENYLESHIPGAVWLDNRGLNHGEKPVSGLLPSTESLEQLFRQAGLEQEQHVLCYDDNGGTSAARCFWVLEAMGHKTVSYLNGGLGAWIASGGETTQEVVTPALTQWQANPDPSVFADKAFVLASLDNTESRILDARSAEEYRGEKSASERKGRIPDARHVNWLDTVDPDNLNRFKPADTLKQMLQERGISPENEVIAHCQTHQRSSHSFVMLRSLGYSRVRGYAGAWADWANDPNTPLETG